MLRLLPHLLLGALAAFFRRLRRGPREPTWGWGLELFVEGQKRAMTHLVRLKGPALRRVSDMKLPPTPAVRALRSEDVDEVTEHGRVRGRWIRAPRTGAVAPGCVMLIHGGGYVVGSVDSHLELAGQLAIAGGFDVFSLDYRLAPEHPHPAALEDARAAYLWLRADLQTQSSEAPQIALVGDSAGAGLSTALLLDRRNANAEQAVGAALICPWVDLTCSYPSIQSNADTDFLTHEMADRWGRDYAGDLDRRHAAISPLFADLHDLPPLLIHAGGAEILRDEIRAFGEKTKAAGVEVTFREWEHMPHDFHILGMVEPRGREALQQVAQFLRRRFGHSD